VAQAILRNVSVKTHPDAMMQFTCAGTHLMHLIAAFREHKCVITFAAIGIIPRDPAMCSSHLSGR